MSGVFAVSRAIWDDPDFANEPLTQREAFLWLLGAAAWKDRKVRVNSTTIELRRGEFCFAIRFLAEKWQWSKSRVARYLDMLQKRDIIRYTERDKLKVYSIKNYNEYQIIGLPKRDTERDNQRDLIGTGAGQDRDKEETLKQENNISPPKPPRGRQLDRESQERFEQFWQTYPRRTAKRSAERAYAQALARASPEEILSGAKRYARERHGQDVRYTAHPATWLNADRWKDEAPARDADWDLLQAL